MRMSANGAMLSMCEALALCPRRLPGVLEEAMARVTTHVKGKAGCHLMVMPRARLFLIPSWDGYTRVRDSELELH